MIFYSNTNIPIISSSRKVYQPAPSTLYLHQPTSRASLEYPEYLSCINGAMTTSSQTQFIIKITVYPLIYLSTIVW